MELLIRRTIHAKAPSLVSFNARPSPGPCNSRPNDRLQATLDTFYTDTEDSGIFRGTETPIASWSGAQFDGAVPGTGPFASAARYSSVVPILRTDTEGNTAEIFAIGGNVTYQATERLSVMADLSRSTLDRSDIDYESYAGTGAARSGLQDTLVFVFDDDGDYRISSDLDYTDPGTVLLTDPGGWGQVGFIKEPQIEDELNQLRLEAEYAVERGPIDNVRVGYLFTDREKSFDSNENFIRASSSFVNGALAIPTGSIVGATDGGTIGLDIIAYDPSSFLTDGTYTLEKATFDTEWVVEEEINTFYAMADIDSTLGTVPVRGNIGFQYVMTEQGSTGTIAGAVNSVEDDYTHFLPSMNLAFQIMPDTYVKVAAAQSITRARLDQLAANQSIGTNPQSCTDTDADQLPDTLLAFNPPSVTCFSLGGGNPTLRPYESTSFDVSFEHYFSGSSAFALAFFHKDLSDWVVDFNALVDAEAQIRAFGAGAFLDANPEVSTAIINGPVNFAEGDITGVEVTLRAYLSDFIDHEFVDGFGFSASYTYADASISDTDGGETTPIPGYSEGIWSGDVYYENHGFRARLSARHRDGFLSEVQNFDGSLSGADALEETILDAQIGYEWDDGPLEGFGINFEAYNITDEPFVTQNNLEDANRNVIGTFPSRHELYGTT